MKREIQFVPASDLAQYIGQEFGPTDWVAITQDMVNAFASLTRDEQFIHVDPQKARATPLGGTIVHGFFTLSMLSWFGSQLGVAPTGLQMAFNYGLNKVRFLQPVPFARAARPSLSRRKATVRFSPARNSSSKSMARTNRQ